MLPWVKVCLVSHSSLSLLTIRQKIKQVFGQYDSQDSGKFSSLAPFGPYVDPFYVSPATTVRLSRGSEDYRTPPAGFQLSTPPRRSYSHRESYSSPPGSQNSSMAPLLPYSSLSDLTPTRFTGPYQTFTVTGVTRVAMR